MINLAIFPGHVPTSQLEYNQSSILDSISRLHTIKVWLSSWQYHSLLNGVPCTTHTRHGTPLVLLLFIAPNKTVYVVYNLNVQYCLVTILFNTYHSDVRVPPATSICNSICFGLFLPDDSTKWMKHDRWKMIHFVPLMLGNRLLSLKINVLPLFIFFQYLLCHGHCDRH